jgi:hypothetical protein
MAAGIVLSNRARGLTRSAPARLARAMVVLLALAAALLRACGDAGDTGAPAGRVTIEHTFRHVVIRFEYPLRAPHDERGPRGARVASTRALVIPAADR